MPRIRQATASAPPALPARRLAVNVALLLVAGLEASIVWMAKPPLVARLAAIAAVLSGVWGLVAAFLLGKVIHLFGDELKKLEERQKALLQSPRLTPWLAGFAVIVAFPCGFAIPWLMDPPPLLCLLPGRGVYNNLTEAGEVRESSFRYVLRVEQGGKRLAEATVTGAGSLYLGRDPQRQAALFKDDLARKSAAAEAYTDRADVLAAWSSPKIRKRVTAAVREGCVEVEILYQAAGRDERITRQAVRVEPEVNVVYLEENDEPCPP